jgi:hypothetical protein
MPRNCKRKRGKIINKGEIEVTGKINANRG